MKYPERDALWVQLLWDQSSDDNPDPGPKQTACHWKCQWGLNLNFDLLFYYQPEWLNVQDFGIDNPR